MSSFELRYGLVRQCVAQNDRVRRWMQFSFSRLRRGSPRRGEGTIRLVFSSSSPPWRCSFSSSDSDLRSGVLVHSRTTHVHVCVIPGIDRSLLDRSGAGSMLFLPFARDSSFYLLLASLATLLNRSYPPPPPSSPPPRQPPSCSPSSLRDCFLNLAYVAESCTRENKMIKNPTGLISVRAQM